jgi:hypothetical protein
MGYSLLGLLKWMAVHWAMVFQIARCRPVAERHIARAIGKKN